MRVCTLSVKFEYDAMYGITFRGSMADVLCRQRGFILGENGDHGVTPWRRELFFFFLKRTGN